MSHIRTGISLGAKCFNNIKSHAIIYIGGYNEILQTPYLRAVCHMRMLFATHYPDYTKKNCLIYQPFLFFKYCKSYASFCEKLDKENKEPLSWDLICLESWNFICTFLMENKETRNFLLLVDSLIAKLFPFSVYIQGDVVTCG